MWILKGSLLGILMFSVLFLFRYHNSFYHVLMGPGVISQITIHNVFFWLGLVGCVLLGCAIVGSWPIKGFFWAP
jgi:hypothetical protein